MKERVYRFFRALNISGLELGDILAAADINRSVVTRWAKPGKPSGSVPTEANMQAVERAFHMVANKRLDSIKSALNLYPKPKGDL